MTAMEYGGPERRRGGPDRRAAGELTRILVVDDHALFRVGIANILEREPDLEVVGEAVDGEDAVRRVSRELPDVVLMDVRMPRLDGIAATARIVASCPDRVRVLMLTTFSDEDAVFGSLRAGASGFLLKDAPPEDLVAAVRTVAAGQALLDPAVTRAVIQASLRGAPRRDAATAQLTARELTTLQLLARGLSNSEIAEHLWLSETTVKTHVSHVLAKLDLRDRVQAVIFAYETGLVETDHS
jgi:DNA-binding NarL/FixJ family response regulator